MEKILVLGASGFVGKNLSKGLIKTEGVTLRCLARNRERIQDLAEAGAECIEGDVSSRESMRHAFQGVHAAYICTHTLSPQNTDPKQDFMDIEMKALENIVIACRENGVRRLIYVTFLGIDPNSPSAWIRGRWKSEQFLLQSGLDITTIRPGQIVGFGGMGFNTMIGQAKRRFAPVLGKGKTPFRNIAVDDLVYYLIGVLNEPKAFGQCFDVGCDDVLTSDQMIDLAADILKRPHPSKVHIPISILWVLAPVIERMAKMPKGAMKGILSGVGTPLVGDPSMIRKILPRPLLTYRQAIERALKNQEKSK